MAVLQHEVHERTKIGPDHRSGCHNRPEFSRGYYAPDREYKPDGTWVIVQRFIRHSMSQECRFDLSLQSAHCAGCKHAGSGEEYAATIRANGS